MFRAQIFYLLLVFGVGAGLAACSNPCEEAVNKTISCAQGEGLKASLRAERDLAESICRPHADRVKECLKLGDCTDFHRCMKKAVFFRENAPTRQSLPGGAQEGGGMEAGAQEGGGEAPQPDMPAIPD